MRSLRKCFFKEILENEKVRFKAKEKGIENDLFEKKLGIKQKKNTSVCLDKGVFLLMQIAITIFIDMLVYEKEYPCPKKDTDKHYLV